MNTNQSQAPFGVPETSDQKKPGKGLLIACISGFAVLGVVSVSSSVILWVQQIVLKVPRLSFIRKLMRGIKTRSGWKIY